MIAVACSGCGDELVDEQRLEAASVRRELAAKQPAFGSSPECTEYLARINSALANFEDCKRGTSLDIFATRQLVLAQAAKLAPLDAAAKPAACKAAVADLSSVLQPPCLR